MIKCRKTIKRTIFPLIATLLFLYISTSYLIPISPAKDLKNQTFITQLTPINHSFILFNTTIQDEYHWLKSRSNLQTIEFLNYIKSENDYTDQVMQHTRNTQLDILSELRNTKFTDRVFSCGFQEYLNYDFKEVPIINIE